MMSETRSVGELLEDLIAALARAAAREDHRREMQETHKRPAETENDDGAQER